MSLRRQLRCVHHYFFIVLIIIKLMPSLVLSSYLEDDETNPIKNVILQSDENSDSSTITTTLTPSFFTTISTVGELNNTTIQSKVDELIANNTTESIKITTESNVLISTTPTDEFDVMKIPACEDIMVESPEQNSSNLRRYLGIKSYVNPMTSFSCIGENITVEDFKFKNSTDSTLTVAWSPPITNNITAYVQWYILEWSSTLAPITKCRCSNKTLSYTIKNLNSCTKFDIGVTPFMSDKSGCPRKVAANTILIVNEETSRLQIDQSGTYWLKTRWSLQNIDCIARYDVNYCDNIKCRRVNVTTTYYNATDLMPCTRYNITVAFYDESGNFGSASVIGNTLFQKPGPPIPVWTLAGRNYLNILWTPPFDASCVVSYRVTISHNDQPQTINTTDTNLTFSKLESCSVYEIIVIAIDKKGGDSNPGIIQSNRTLAPIPQSPIEQHSPTATNDTITLYWFLPINVTNNCSNIEITTKCTVIKVLGDGYVGLNGTSSFNITDGKAVTSIHGLTPYTNYTCQSIASNAQGASNKSVVDSVLTSDYVPSPVPTPNVYDITHKNFTIKWDKPPYLPGELILFEVMFMWYYPFHRPEWCEKFPTVTEKVGNISGNIFSLTYEKIKPYSKYIVKIRAKTRAGWGLYSDGSQFHTLPGAPGPVSHMEFFTRLNPNDINILEPYLTWRWPCLMNADDIEFFNISAIGERANFPIHQFTDTLSGGIKICTNDTCTYTFNDNRLKEEYKYDFSVAGVVANAPQMGEVKEIKGTFPAGIPPEPDVNYTNQITIDPYKTRRTTTTATVLLPLFPNTLGDIRCYAIIVSKSGYNIGNSSRLNLIKGEWPDIASWNESMIVDFTIPYQAAQYCDNSNPLGITDYGKFKAVKFVIGEDTETCPELSLNQHERSYCNGPLKPDTWYDVRMRAFTNGGYRDSTIFTIKTNAELQVAVVIGTIFGILFLGILITMMLLVRKCSIHAILRRFLHSDMPGSPVPTPFNRRKFIAHCQELADNPGKLSNEFQLLQTLSVDLQMPTNAACLQANRKKNRYTDILPYDFSRVKLEVIDNDPNTDYINASFIKGCNGDEEYIACQGPKEETTHDFWRMIDQYDVKLIVMLTQLMEKNKEKCHQYYPTIRETFTYENMSIRCSSELDYRTYTQRTLILQKENEKRTILHLHFKDWPDHDVPEDFDPMINFCQIMRRHISVNRGLAVIHCSAGIGRTGTLIAIDILLQYIKENRKLDVFGTVYRLRHHRINMVQRESQYAYIYNCIRQVLKNPYFSKSYKPPSVDPIVDNNSNNKKKTNSRMNLVSSLETLKKSRLSSSSIESAEEIYNSSTSTSSSIPKSDENCLLLQGQRFSKSTSAICFKPHQNKIVRYNTVDFPIFKLGRDIERKSSSCSLDEVGESDDSIDSTYENHQELNRLKLTNITDHDSLINQKLLDTSL